MLQSIQFIGSGPPTYVYSQKATGATMDFYYVLAAETREYKGNRERENANANRKRRELEKEAVEFEEFKMIDNTKKESLQELYQRECGRRESFLWKQR